MHLSDAFIQSDLHCIQVTVFTFYQLLFRKPVAQMVKLSLVKTMVNLWLPWFNYSNHVFLVLFVVKPWIIFVRLVKSQVEKIGTFNFYSV